MSGSTPIPEDSEVITPSALKAAIDDGDPVGLLDVRARDEFEEWHIDGPSVEVANVPYFELLDGVEGHLDRIPDTGPVVVVCAKGGSSEMVADQLRAAGVDAVNLERGMNGWATVYEYHEIDADTDATIAQYQRPSSGCLSYLVADGEAAAVVDPLRAFADEYVRDARALGAELRYAIDTHIHADHLSGVRELADRGVEPVVPAASVDRGLTDTEEVTTADDGDSLQVGATEIEAMYTPGHTSGMTSYLVDDAVLLTGDGLFVESVARPDLEEGDEGAPDAARQLHESLHERVLALPDDVVVGGAHFSDAAEPAPDGTYTATIGELTDQMGALDLDREAFVDLVLSEMPPRPANYTEIIETNLGRRRVDDAEAFELELGPNNCAASKEALTGD